MKEENNKVGHITVGYGTSEQREIELINRITFQFADHRMITIGQLEGDNGFTFTVENLPSSGRSTQSNMWLSETSFKAFIHSINVYYASKGWVIQDELKDVIGRDMLNYWADGDIKCIFDTPPPIEQG